MRPVGINPFQPGDLVEPIDPRTERYLLPFEDDDRCELDLQKQIFDSWDGETPYVITSVTTNNIKYSGMLKGYRWYRYKKYTHIRKILND